MGFNNKSHFLNYDQFQLLKILHYYQPDTLLKLESSKDLIERLNFIIGKLANRYIKYSEPYNMSDQSSNKKFLNLSKIYQFQLARPTINTSFPQSPKTFILGADDLPDKLSMLAILKLIWFLDLMEKIKPL